MSVDGSGHTIKMTDIQTANFEKISVKIESNSRGFTTSIHVYQGVKEQEIDDTIDKAIYAHNELLLKLRKDTVTNKEKVIPELA